MTQRIARFSRGEVLRASRLNEVVDVINVGLASPQDATQATPTSGIPGATLTTWTEVSRTQTTVTLQDADGNQMAFALSATPLVCQATLVSQGGDWLYVLADSAYFYVAKPYLLRRSLASWNGITFAYSSNFEREATDGVDTEDQVIVPAYVPDDILYIVRPYGGTGTVDDGGNAIVWLDLNVDGRAWAKEAE